MAAVQRNIPALRFPEFNGEWEAKRIGELCSTFKSGISITSRDIKELGKFPVYGGNGLRGYSDKYTHNGFYFLIGRQGALCGNINRAYGKVYISEHAIAVQGNSVSDTEWLAQRLDYYNLNRLSESSAQPGLSVNKLVRYKLCVPDQFEQQKIADFLTGVDGKIGLLSKKKDLLERYKKGVMQKLFSQSLRFTTKDGTPYPDWEEKTLGEIGDIIGGGTPDTGNSGYWQGEIIWLTPTEIKEKYINGSSRKITGLGLKNSSAKILPTGTLLFTSRANVADIAIAKSEMSTNQGFQSIVINNQNCNEFLYYWILHNKKKFIRKASGSTFLEISNKEVKKIKLLAPHKEEQQKIADFLSSLDQKITHVSQQLTQARAFKKGLLQQMFV